jgi:hypothetical protein
MQEQHRTREQALLAGILKKNPAFGTKGYLERIHAPNAPGPGPAQRPSTSKRPTDRQGAR